MWYTLEAGDAAAQSLLDPWFSSVFSPMVTEVAAFEN